MPSPAAPARDEGWYAFSPVDAPARVVLLDCSTRVAPGCLTLDAWDALRSARRVFCGSADHPQLPALAHAGIDIEIRSTDNPIELAAALLAAGRDGSVVWLVAPDGDAALSAALASRLVLARGADDVVEVEHLLGSYDLPGAHVLDLVAVMDRLRSPGGCPWDAEQTHESLSRYLIEEAYEVAEAIDTGDRDHLVEELGDVLLQVMFHARVAAESSSSPFSVDDVADGIVTKLVRRHPHVFADGDAATPADVEQSWEQIKAAEKGRTSILDGIPPSLPALSYAEKVLVRAERTGVRLAPIGSGRVIEDEAALAAALLELVAAAHARGLDPETALRRAVRRMAEPDAATSDLPTDPR